MKNMVYALRIDGQTDVLEVISGTRYGSYKFRRPFDGKEGTWAELTDRDATSEYYDSQFGSVQGTVRCTGCHASLNLASEWAAEALGTWMPNADCYGFEFEGKFNDPPSLEISQPEFDFECYGGEPCFAHMRTHYYPEKSGEPYTKIPIDPQPQPWLHLPISYRQYIVDRYGEPPVALGGKTEMSVVDWLENVRNRQGGKPLSRAECCIHCRMAMSLSGFEGQILEIVTIEDKFEEHGGNRSSCLPNDHAVRIDGMAWEDECPKHPGEHLPNITDVNCKVHCCHSGLHLLFSYRTAKGEKPGRYKVADTLYFCNGDKVTPFVLKTCFRQHTPSQYRFCGWCGQELGSTSEVWDDECPNKCPQLKYCTECGDGLLKATWPEELRNSTIGKRFSATLDEAIKAQTLRNSGGVSVTVKNGSCVKDRVAQHWWSTILGVSNQGTKSVRAFSGALICRDIFGTITCRLLTKVDWIEAIPESGEVDVPVHWPMNQFSDEYRWLSSRRFQDMSWAFEMQQVVFTDGSVWTP